MAAGLRGMGVKHSEGAHGYNAARRLIFGAMLGLMVAGTVNQVRGQPVRHFEAGYERDVNRFRWTANMHFNQRIGAWEFSTANRFSSDAFILFENRLSFRDESHVQWQLRRPFGNLYALRVEGVAAWYSLSRVFNQTILAGMRYSPHAYAWLEPVLGLAWDRRPGAVVDVGPAPVRLDAGPALGVRGALAPPPVNAYRLRLEGESTWQLINPRRGRAVRLHGRAERTYEGTRFLTDVRLLSFRRDAYQAVSFLNRNLATDKFSESIEATTSDTLSARIELDTHVHQQLRFVNRLDLSLNNRFIRNLRAPASTLFFDSDFNRRAFELESGLEYDTPDLAGRLAVRGGAEVERRSLANTADLPETQAAQKSALLKQADNDRGYLLIMGRARATVTHFLGLNVDATASTLRYNTPEINQDDRDELFYNGTFGVLLRPNRYFRINTQVFGTFFHTVYLKAIRSAENNVQRSLRFRPTVQWTPSRRSHVRLVSEVRATYTVDDFVLPGRRPTDQSARELSFEVDARQDLGQGVELHTTGSYSDLRLGRFFKKRFSEIPFDTLQTYSGWVRLKAGRRVSAEIGLRYFIRSDFDRATTVRYDQVDDAGDVLRDEGGTVLQSTISRPGRVSIEQIGPTGSLVWPMRNGSALRFEGWFTVQHIRQHLFGDLPEASARRIRRAGRRGIRSIIPNLSVSMLWNF